MHFACRRCFPSYLVAYGLQEKCSSRTKCLGCWSLRAEHEQSPAAEFLLTERRPNEKSRSLQQLGKCYLLSVVDGIIHTLASNSLSSKAEYDTTVGSALKRVYRTMRTRPRRSHHRRRCRKTPPTIAAALQSSPGRVWTPVLVRDRPWLHDSASRTRLHSFSVFLVLFGLSCGLLLVSGCLSVCVLCLGACVCVRAWARLCFSAVPVLLRRPFRGLASRVCLLVLFSGVFSGISQDTWGPDESATRPEQSRKSSELRVQ